MIVLGFWQRIFGKKKEEEFTKETFTLDEARSFVERKLQERSEPFIQRANKIYSEMQSTATKFQSSLKDLNKANFTGKVDTELLQNVVAHRKSFVNKMNMVIKEINKPLETDFDNFIEYYNSIANTINDVNQRTVKDYHFLKELFAQEANAVIQNFKELDQTSKNFANLINENRDEFNSIKSTKNEIQVLAEEIKDLEQKKSGTEKLEKKMSELKAKQTTAIEELEKIKTSDELKQCNEILRKRQEVELDIARVESEITRAFSRIERPLRKFNKLIQSDLEEFEDKKALEILIDSPSEAFLKEKNSEFVNYILKKIQALISEDKIELKDKEKILSEIKWLLENKVFEEFAAKHNSLMQQLENLQSFDDKILNAKNEVENQINLIQKELDQTNSEIAKTKNQINKIESSINERKNKIENAFEPLVNKKISIKL